METRAFAPLYKKSIPGTANGVLIASVTASASNSSATITLPAGNNSNQIQIANTTTAWAYVNFGVDGNVTAATVAASYPVPPGLTRIVSIDSEVTGASVILGTSTGSVIFTRGEG